MNTTAIPALITALREFKAMIDSSQITIDADPLNMPRAVELLDAIDAHLSALTENSVTPKTEHQRLEAFARRFLNPEEYGFSVSAIIRDDAREVLGIKPCETPRLHRA